MLYFASTAFAVEGITANELKKLGITPKADTGRVYFEGTEQDAARACINLRSADRISLRVAAFDAPDFDALFEGIRQAPWKSYISRHGKINVNATAKNSRLMSLRDIQSVAKKAIIAALGGGILPENGEVCTVNITVANNKAEVSIDLCGDGLHKRGYRVRTAPAPLRETMAAALLLLSGYDGTLFADPFCGSGTLPIEAALIARNIAPGARRTFAAEQLVFCNKALWKQEKQLALSKENKEKPLIYCADIEREMVEMTAYHARLAGVDDIVRPVQADARRLSLPQYGGLLISNPPYGERLSDKTAAHSLLCELSPAMQSLCEQYWSIGIITPDSKCPQALQMKASASRRFFNADLACVYYRFTPPGL